MKTTFTNFPPDPLGRRYSLPAKDKLITSGWNHGGDGSFQLKAERCEQRLNLFDGRVFIWIATYPVERIVVEIHSTFLFKRILAHDDGLGDEDKRKEQSNENSLNERRHRDKGALDEIPNWTGPVGIINGDYEMALLAN